MRLNTTTNPAEEKIIQILSRQNWNQIDINFGKPVKDEIWGLSSHGRLFQMTDGGWTLRLGELD